MQEVTPCHIEGIRSKIEDTRFLVKSELFALILNGASHIGMTNASTFGLARYFLSVSNRSKKVKFRGSVRSKTPKDASVEQNLRGDRRLLPDLRAFAKETHTRSRRE